VRMSTSSILSSPSSPPSHRCSWFKSFSRAGTALNIFVSFALLRKLNPGAAFRSSEMQSRLDHVKRQQHIF
jgi:hypothetical protein